MKLTVDQLYRGIIENVNGDYTSCKVAKDKWNKTIKALEIAGFKGEVKPYGDGFSGRFERVGEDVNSIDFFYSINMWYELDHHAELITITLKGIKRTSLHARKFKIEEFNLKGEINNKNGIIVA